MKKGFLASTAMLAVMVGGGQTAAAQTTPAAPEATQATQPDNAQPDDVSLGDIVVTAQKRSQRLQDVPVTVAAVSSEILTKNAIDSTVSLTSVVPGLNLQASAAGFRPFIRGVGTATSTAGNENSVSTYLDNVYLASMNAGLLNLASMGDEVIADNERRNEPTAPAFRMAFDSDNVRDHIHYSAIVHWRMPGNIRQTIGGHAADDESRTFMTNQAHLMTPETETSSHYFWKYARDYAIGDEDFTERQLAVVTQAFANEDRPMIEAQQRNMDGRSFMEMNPLLLKSDEAAVRARRILEAKLKEQELAA